MDIIIWNEGLSVSNFAVDEQHKELIKIINEVATLIKGKDYTFSNLVSVTCKLDDYIENHLKYEEMLMDKYNIKGKEEHIKEHNNARKKIYGINVIDEENFEEEFFLDTLGWLSNWLLTHIMKTDKMLDIYQ